MKYKCKLWSMDGENSKQLKTNANASNDQCETFRTSFSLVNSDCSSSRTEWETNLEESGRRSAKISDSPDNVSSPWSNSSSDELFQYPRVLPKSREPNDIPKPNEGAKTLYKNGKVYVPTGAWRSLEESVSDSPGSTSKFSDVTLESFVLHILPTESPAIQVMERTESFDPNRSPASIFSTPAMPMEWSIASNESLFSIHIGNDIFSKDHELRMSGDMYKSGELPVSGELLKSGELYLSRKFYRSGELYQSGELYNSGERKRSDELIRLLQTSPAAKRVEPAQNTEKSKDVIEDMKPEATTSMDEPNSDVPEACINIQSGTNLSGSSDPCNANHHPDGNKICIQAFVSPTKKKPACRICHCLYSSWMYCCCKWPSCCCKWSGCSCKWFGWPSCSSNCLSWPCCCCKWPNCCNCKWPSCYLKCLTWSSCCC